MHLVQSWFEDIMFRMTAFDWVTLFVTNLLYKYTFCRNVLLQEASYTKSGHPGSGSQAETKPQVYQVLQ